MLFNSIDFLCFFPIVVLLYFIVPQKYRYIWLLAASYYFYMCWNVKYVLLLLSSTLVTYIMAIALEKASSAVQKKLFMTLCILFNLAILAYFKYANFAILCINKVLSCLHISVINRTVDVLLPVGISFYTFQALGYVIDVYRGNVTAEKHFLKYALFVSFFPQLVAGPIERSKNLLSQIQKPTKFNFDNLKEGLLLMIWGFFVKVVLADRIAVFVDAVYGNLNTYQGYYILVATVLFAFQIYGDFAGYSIIAMGAAKVLGFELMDNFNAPYFSRSVSEFWRRWHISLSYWFRDYLYIPLGGNRKGKFRKYLNRMIVFFVSGLWHGAGMHYILWGGINGAYQVIGELLMPVRNKLQKILGLDRNRFSHKLMKVIITFILIDLSWVFFRADSTRSALFALRSIFAAENPWILFDGSLYTLGISEKGFHVIWIGIAALLAADFFKYKGIKVRDAVLRQELWFQWGVSIFMIITILVLGVYGSGYDSSGFIYFQF
ncbi:MAG: MBOAT family protein [Clostridiales bacterium]|nr:MBOAT family protein [Clostridiales bacterium]